MIAIRDDGVHDAETIMVVPKTALGKFVCVQYATSGLVDVCRR